NPRVWRLSLASFAQQAATGVIFRPKATEELQLDSGTAVSVGGELACFSARRAVKLLSESTDNYAKLHLYFIAQEVFRVLKENEDLSECQQILEAALRSCEEANT